MRDKKDLTVLLGSRLASKTSRRGFLGFAAMSALGLGVGLNGASLAWADACAGCPNSDCGCPNPGSCCLVYANDSCGKNPGTYACSSFGCDSRCTQASWTCCYGGCQWLFLRHSRHDSLWGRLLSPGGGMTFRGISTPLLTRQKGVTVVLMGLAATAGAGLGLNGVRMSSAALLWSALTLAIIVGWSTAASP